MGKVEKILRRRAPQDDGTGEDVGLFLTGSVILSEAKNLERTWKR